ncbi:Inner membrane protein YigG [Escherichia coli]|nr:Inner membrane protein YigG [Escherichia coli]
MLRIFIPTSNGKISRRRYIFSFILINFIFAFLIIFFNDGEAGFLVIVSTIVLHYLVINMNCQRLRDSGFIYIKLMFWYISSIYHLYHHNDSRRFACSGNGSMIFDLLFFHFQYANACTY